MLGIESPSYRSFRYPAGIIGHCVWLYHRFPLSLREVEEMMAQRGVVVSHQTVRQWCRSLGRPTPSACADAGVAQGTSDTSTRYSSRSTLRSTICGGRWTSTGTSWTFWSPPDETPRPRPSSSKLLTRLEYVLRALVSDKLASDQAARRRALRSVEHRQSKYLNNRAQNFHQPTRAHERER
jgi:putative transposase